MTEDEMAKEIAEMSDEEVKANVHRVFGDDLARRAVACKAWKWMPGMRYVALSGYRYRVDDVAHAGGDTLSHDCLPDLTDPATIGCLLALVREAWEAPDAHTMRYWRPDNTFAWLCVSPDAMLPTRQSYGETEAEALVVSLESMNDD
jgi:hypothetical protein